MAGIWCPASPLPSGAASAMSSGIWRAGRSKKDTSWDLRGNSFPAAARRSRRRGSSSLIRRRRDARTNALVELLLQLHDSPSERDTRDESAGMAFIDRLARGGVLLEKAHNIRHRITALLPGTIAQLDEGRQHRP